MTHKITYDFLKENDLILLEVIVGSQAYSTNTPTSDIDKKFVYILPLDNILGTGYVEQINVDKDYCGYEIKRFLELLGTNNPTILELIASPDDCILYKHPLFNKIIERKDEFITKQAKNSFAGYAIAQIKKASGLDKKQNWEKDKVTRKDVLDFVYVLEDGKSITWKHWNQYRGHEEKFCGVVNLPNAKDVYAVYFDGDAYACFSENIPEDIREMHKKNRTKDGKPMGFGYKGLVKVGEGDNFGESNQLRLSSIPKGEKPICTISFNKDGYTQHCKDFKEYEEWLNNRNMSRYVQNQEHGQTYDSKNLTHCVRLIRMAQEIGRGEGILVRRADREELLKIRRGEVKLEELISSANESIKELDEIFDNSSLPDKVDPTLVNELLTSIRKEFYNLK